MDVLYSPDGFGHPDVLPALARQFGVEAGVAWRGVGRPQGQDRDLHHWSAHSGEAILLYQLPPDGYSVGAELATTPDDRLSRVWARIRQPLVARAATSQVAVFVGADHHAAPPDLASLRERLQALEPDHEVRISGLTEFFASLTGLDLPPGGILRGELRRIERHTWVLQGVHGTRSRLKRDHSLVELELSRLTEPLAALGAIEAGLDQRGLLRQAWRTLLQSQFHDTLGGCSADLVAREQQVRLWSVKALSGEIAARSWRTLVSHDPDAARQVPGAAAPALFLWNPCARRRGGIVTAELSFFRRDVLVGPPNGRRARTGAGYQPFAVTTPSGEQRPVQVLAIRPDQERLDADHHYPDQDDVDRVFIAFQSAPLDGLAIQRLGVRPSRRVPGTQSLAVKPDTLANRFVVAKVSPAGVITLEERVTGERYPGLCLLEDEPDRGDSYTFSRGRGRLARGGRPRSRRLVAGGPLIGAIETRWSMAAAGRGDLECRLLAILHADSPLLRLRLDIDNVASDHRLRARFAVGAGEDALAGAAFGVELRLPVTREHRHEETIERPVATAPAHQFVAAAEYSRGLAILAPGFFEYEWTADQDFAITLMRSVGELSKAELPERPGHAGWPQATPLAQESGLHTVQLALAPIAEEDLARPDRLIELWEDAFLPLQSTFFRNYHGAGAALTSPGIRLEGAGLVLSAIKPAEAGAGLILRCCNLTALPTQGRCSFARTLSSAWLVRADETEPDELELDPDRRSVRFGAGPYQLITIRVLPD